MQRARNITITFPLRFIVPLHKIKCCSEAHKGLLLPILKNLTPYILLVHNNVGFKIL